MKKTLTQKDIESLHHDSLVALLLSLANSNDDIYEKVEKLLLSDDPKALYKSIMKDISSIKRGRKFIHYGDSFAFSKKIAAIVEDITSFVDEDKSAATLLKALILTDSKVYLRSDDSAGVIQNAYALAEDDWKGRVQNAEEKHLLEDLLEMLLCEGFGIRDIFSKDFPVRIYEKLYDSVLLSYTLEAEQFEKSSYKHVLLSIAEYLCSPLLYIKTKELDSEPFVSHDYFDIAQQYQRVDDARKALEYVDKIEKNWYQQEKVFALQVWAYGMLEEDENVTKTYKAWYEQKKSPETYKRYSERLEGKEKEKMLERVFEDIEALRFSEAVVFYHVLDEKRRCANFIMIHREDIETVYMNQRKLERFLAWLSDGYAQEAILLYRDICENALATKQSKYYGAAIWALEEMVKLEEIYHDIVWKIEDNHSYIDNLLEAHKLKRKFLELFDRAFGA